MWNTSTYIIAIFQYWHRDTVSKAIRHKDNPEPGMSLSGPQDRGRTTPRTKDKGAPVDLHGQGARTVKYRADAIHDHHTNMRQNFDIVSRTVLECGMAGHKSNT